MEPDILKRFAEPLRNLFAWLIVAALPVSPPAALPLLVDFAGLVVLAAMLAVLGLALDSAAAGAPGGSRGRIAVVALTGVPAAALFAWILRHPSPTFDGIFGRWDHLVMAALAGMAIGRVSAVWSKVTLALVSTAFLVEYCGWQAVGLVAGGCLLGFVILGRMRPARGWVIVLPQAALLAACYGCALWVRQGSVLEGLRIEGLLAFAALRHISFAVDASSRPVSLSNYLTYMSFYPGAVGTFAGPEVYAEFSRRNLIRRTPIDYRMAARRVVHSVLQVGVVALIPLSVEDILVSRGFVQAWTFAVALFVRSALGVMGCWAMIDAIALFYGVRLHANFRRLLVCQNPSEFWRSWRGTFTNWLVLHVYAPLGASRRHASLNILAAFGVSLLWHALGVPFLHADFRAAHLAPVTLWAAVNAVAVLAHMHFHRLMPGPPSARLRPLKIVLTWLLGALTPLLLYFQGNRFPDFPRVVRLLVGLGPAPFDTTQLRW